MLNTWQFNIISYLIIYVIFSQSFKMATNKSRNDADLIILLQFFSGIFVLFFLPFFNFNFPANIYTYILFLISCIFYAISARLRTTARRGLDVATYGILGQLSTIFIIIFGILFFKEKILLKHLLGTIFIIIGNIFVLYKKGKFEWNKYIFYSLIGNFTFSIAITIDIGISTQFNLPLYISLSLIIPALLIMIFEKRKTNDIIEEFKFGEKISILIVSLTWGLSTITNLRAYQFGKITIIAPLVALTTILNVFVAYFILKEKENFIKKIVSALIVIIGIILIKT